MSSDAGGYDASEGPPDTVESVALSDIFESAEDDGDTLSVDVEDLGAHALREAAQQGDFAPKDVGDEFDTPSGRSDLDSPGESEMEPGIVDLTDNTIRNGSIFDQPRAGEMGQVRHPLIKTDEVDATLDRNERARRARKARR